MISPKLIHELNKQTRRRRNPALLELRNFPQYSPLQIGLRRLNGVLFLNSTACLLRGNNLGRAPAARHESDST